MKKIFFSLALVAGTFALAQQTNAGNSSSSVRFGLKAGLNISRFSDSDSRFKTGFNAGVFANIPVAKDFSFQPEVLYNQVGTKAKANSGLKVNVDYISVPLMLQYNALPNLYLEAGPQFSFLVNSKLRYKSYSTNTKDQFKTFDFGVGIGAGYYLTENIGITARYVAGLTDVVKNTPGVYDGKSKNNVIQVGLVYKF
ncbi:PorT family protein [Chryseobacterium sp. Tr-659]|uniref:porin family protein n=1 Tax=Chryseobacterium sp. Tr-659 TaxID=2608340 RepID=UPI0014224432|nr:porin family protein [Chryseobacterium sp. Tr-659]NIF05255.1 PorT family protein [Chryseobacterium sp. Tr-659]